MQKITPFKFSLLPGDLINFLPGVKHICEATKTKAALFLGLNIEWAMSEPVSRGRASNITLTEKHLEMFRPLLLNQSYIASVDSLEKKNPDLYNQWCEAFKTAADYQSAAKWYSEHDEMIDLDKQHLIPCNIPYGNIFRWQFYAYPEMSCDLSKPWLSVPVNDSVPDKTIVINRTERSRNEIINYKFLFDYKDRIVFAGSYQEWLRFRQDTGFEVAFFEAKDFLELAIAIRSCKFFIGNQSLCFSLAEAMKVPRILETCPYLPNVIPCGEKAYDFYNNSCFQMLVKMLDR